MADGGVDLAVGWLPDLAAGFHKPRLFDQRYVALMAASHPLARPTVLQLPHFAVDVFWHRRVHQDAGNRWLREQYARWFGEPAD